MRAEARRHRVPVGPQSPLLELHNVSVVRGGHRVFDRLSLEVPSDRSTVILGPNGAGKSTLVRLMMRDLHPLHSPDSSLAVLGRKRWNTALLRQSMGFVSQELQRRYQRAVSGLDVVLSGFFWSVGLTPFHQPTTEQVARAREIGARLGAAALLERSFNRLSAGEQGRLLLARALVHEPEFLLLDEPLNSLDLKAGIELLRDLREEIARGRKLVVITHRVEEIVPEIEHVVLLREGRRVAEGDRREVLTAEALSDLYEVRLEVVERNGFLRVVPAI